MKVRQTALPEVLLIEPRIFSDERGSFKEVYRKERYREHGIKPDFVQDNISISKRGVIRGLHFQNPPPQDKLVHVLKGAAFDVAVDIRPGSPTFGRWVGELLSADNHRQLFIPGGFAHGFCALTDECIFAYKCSRQYDPSAELAVAWNDPDIGIAWPSEDPVVSERDQTAPRLAHLDQAALPSYPGSSR